MSNNRSYVKTLVSNSFQELREEQIIEELEDRSDHPITSDDTTTFVGSDFTVKEINIFYIPWMERCVTDHKLFDLVK